MTFFSADYTLSLVRPLGYTTGSDDYPVTVLPNSPLLKTAFVLATNKIGCLPVVCVGHELQGMLTTTDLLRHVTGHARQSLETGFQFYSPNGVCARGGRCSRPG